MKNLMILTLLLIFAVACKSECIEEAPVEVAPAEMTDEQIKETVF
tara:strand:- start:224 stop:358 length:135 start_codon:yes stop_codon:yes gene_type:complete